MKPDRLLKWCVIPIGLVIFLGSIVYSRTVLQIVPTLTISEEYRDNYFSTASNKQEEYITSCIVGFSVGFLEQNYNLYINYNPEYQDYKNLSDRDRIRHNISVSGEFRPTKRTSLELSAVYDGDSDNYAGETRSNEATVAATSQLTKNTTLSYSYNYANRFEQQVRTGEYKEHTLHTNAIELSNQFGKSDLLRITFLHEFDDYQTDDADAYTMYRPEGYISYRFTPQKGMDAHISFQNKDFEDSDEYVETLSGDIRYIQNITRNLDWYLKYRHSYSDTNEYTHHVFHPSAGIDWEITEDSGISVGAGVLFHEWSNDYDDDPDPFLDISAYKIWDFSRRGSISLTASSGYSESSDDASSLGYNTFYQAGARLEYQLAKRVASNLFTSFRLDEYQQNGADRSDETLNAGAGISWQPLKWLVLNLNYTFTQFDTSSSLREDYQDNTIFFSVDLIPETPIRPDVTPSRSALKSALHLER